MVLTVLSMEDSSILFLNKTERLFIQFVKELQEDFKKRGNIIAIKMISVRNFFGVKFHVHDDGAVSTIKRSMHHYNDYVTKDYKYDIGKKRLKEEDCNVFWIKRIEKRIHDDMYTILRDGIIDNF